MTNEIKTKVRNLYTAKEADTQEMETARRFTESRRITGFIPGDRDRDEIIIENGESIAVRVFSINGINFHVPTDRMVEMPEDIYEIYANNEIQRKKVNPVGGHNYMEEIELRF